MKKKFLALLLSVSMMPLASGCGTESSRVSYNLSQEADNSLRITSWR